MDTFWNHTMYKAIVIFLLFNLAGTSTYQSMAATLIAGIGVIICLVALTKWYFGGGVCKSKARLDGKKNDCKLLLDSIRS